MGNSNPLISVIIPCYNQGKYIEETIHSVLNSTYSEFEIIIVNDGSTDSYTNNLLEEQSWPKTRTYNILNQGVSNARNFGIKNANGSYILPLDADDKIDKTYIEKAIKIFEENQNVLLVYCKARFFGKKNGDWLLPDFSVEMILGQNVIFCSAIYRKVDFEKTIGYNPVMQGGFEDWDFWLSLIEAGQNRKIIRIEEPLFFYRIKSRSRNNSINSQLYIDLRKKIYSNHKSLYSDNFFNPLFSFEYSNLQRSPEYKVGSLILAPIKLYYNLIKKCL